MHTLQDPTQRMSRQWQPARWSLYRRADVSSFVTWPVFFFLLLGCSGGEGMLGPVDRVDRNGRPIAALEEGEWLPGGETTNLLLFGRQAFTLPFTNIDGEVRRKFSAGDSFFDSAWVIAPASAAARDGLGPTFNAVACSTCHSSDGRGAPPESPDEEPVDLLFRISLEDLDGGDPTPHPSYGEQFQPFGIPDVPGEVTIRVSYEREEGAFADGTPYALSRPVYTFEDPAFGPLEGPNGEALLSSPRVAPHVIGLGLLEAIPLSRLRELEDPDDENEDGVSGRVNEVFDEESQRKRPGRFGWKAEKASVRAQSAAAFLGDIGVTTPIFPENNCPEPQTACQDARSGGDPEVSELLLDAVATYTQALAVPGRRSLEEENILRGKWLFREAKCATCHVPSHTTATAPEAGASLPEDEVGQEPLLAEVSGQKIWPYTDLLLHDMGEALSDGRPSAKANGNEWRTPPLWGLGLLPEVNGHQRLLHDGRADGFAEAILWHGGEAEASKQAFVEMDAEDREALIAFLESL